MAFRKQPNRKQPLGNGLGLSLKECVNVGSLIIHQSIVKVWAKQNTNTYNSEIDVGRFWPTNMSHQENDVHECKNWDNCDQTSIYHRPKFLLQVGAQRKIFHSKNGKKYLIKAKNLFVEDFNWKSFVVYFYKYFLR